MAQNHSLAALNYSQSQISISQYTAADQEV